MSVAEGMDTGRARSVAGTLRSQSSVLGDIAARGSSMMGLLEDVWQGQDVEQFAREWSSARPQLDRAEQLVRDMGEELTRQADDQDRASDGEGFGPGEPRIPTIPKLPDLPQLPKLPRLPSFPDIFGAIGDFLKGAWDFLRSFAYSIPAFFSDLLGWADEAFNALKNLKWLKWLSLPLKLLGKVTPFVGAILGLWDMGESIYRWFTEGFSKDSVLQFFQGLTGTIAGGLFMGYTRKTAARYSFLLAIPAVVASGGLQVVKVAGGEGTGETGWGPIIAATIIAFIVGYAVIAWFMKFIETHTFTVFMIYRIILALVLFALLGTGTISA